MPDLKTASPLSDRNVHEKWLQAHSANDTPLYKEHTTHFQRNIPYVIKLVWCCMRRQHILTTQWRMLVAGITSSAVRRTYQKQSPCHQLLTFWWKMFIWKSFLWHMLCIFQWLDCQYSKPGP
jgi:hypothetical protein